MTNQFVNPACLEGLQLLTEHRLVRLATPPPDIFAAFAGPSAPDTEEKKDPRLTASYDDRVRFDAAGSVVSLDLGGTRLRCAPSVLAVLGRFPKLVAVSLGGTHLPVSDALAALARVRGLECVHLGGNGAGPEGAAAIAASELFPADGSGGRLRKLDLRYNAIGDDGAAALAGAILNERHLHSLYLEGNAIGDAGCAALAAVLSAPSCPLRELYLGDNAIGPAGARALAASLRDNATLATLYLEGNGLGEEGVTAMCELLETRAEGAGGLNLYVENNTEIGKAVSERLVKAMRREQGA